jgi:hypothetical protein
MNKELITFYQTKLSGHNDTLKSVTSRARLISILRLLVFVLAVITIYIFAKHQSAEGIVSTIIISTTLFVLLIKYHTRIIYQKKIEESLVQINENELSALNGNFAGFEDGNEFESAEHVYAIDLDIFGEGSLFQFLNRSATYIGAQQLASKLKFPILQIEALKKEQLGIQELSEKIEWRQQFHAIGMAHKEKKDDKEKIINWSKLTPYFQNPVFLILTIAIPFLTALMIMLLSIGSITEKMFIVYLTIPWAIAGSYALKVNKRHLMVSKTSETLEKYAKLLSLIESKDLSSEKFTALKRQLSTDGKPASQHIKKLSSILTALDNRLNFVSWALLNALFLWDILQMKRLENWQKKHATDVENWFEMIAETDALNSLSNYSYNQPGAIIPKLQDELYDLEAQELGHPLINATVRVSNDVSIKNREFKIITGANMAGKSTYLRTIGVNLVLAMCGAPVCAKSFTFKPVQIYSSIRTRDSLHKNESYFYAELKQLQLIIDTLKKGERLFIILDEILKGTNSKDKHAGSEALLKQLIRYQASGIVATHDVGLGKLQEIFPENINNNCFEVDIVGNKLHFDYKLREGVSQNLNATFLMREMGITI